MKTSSATNLDLVEGGKPSAEQDASPSFENAIKDELNEALETISEDYATGKRSQTAPRKINIDIEITKQFDKNIFSIRCKTKLTLPPTGKLISYEGDIGQMRLFE